MLKKMTLAIVVALLVQWLPVQRCSAQGAAPLGWWKLDEGAGTTATDLSGNGNHGTLGGAPTWVDDPERGAVLSFDGDNDYVETGLTIPAMDLENGRGRSRIWTARTHRFW